MNTTAIINGRKLAAAKILAACDEHDRLGRNGFLDRYGFQRATRWHLRVNGRSYPSKAIVGVAAGLKAADFFGGIRSRHLENYLAPFREGGTVSLDSCWITANVGRAGKGRRLTRARDTATRVLQRTAATVELAVYCCLAGAGLTA